MLVYIIAILEALAYVGAVPVWVAFCLSTEGGLRAGTGVGVFERRFALRKAREASRSPIAKEGRSRKGDLRRTLAVLKRLRNAGIRLRGRLGLGDAAATAVACGALQALGPALAARAGRVDIAVTPDFDSPELHIELQGMIRVRVGQIISAGVRSGMDALLHSGKRDLIRRGFKWTSIPSKASWPPPWRASGT